MDNLINILRGNDQTFEDMGTFLSLTQLKLGSACNHFMTMVDERLQHLFQIESFRTTIHKCHIVDAERSLHLGHLVEFIQHHIGISIAFELDDNTHTLVVTFVVDIGDTIKFLLSHKVGNI